MSNGDRTHAKLTIEASWRRRIARRRHRYHLADIPSSNASSSELTMLPEVFTLFLIILRS